MTRLAVLLAVSTLAATAHADDSEVVTHLALFELAGGGFQDQLARDLSKAVRREVVDTPGHQLSEARVSLEQLSLVQDCDPEELSCLGKIAKQLGVSGFIFGKLSKEGSGAFAELSLFDAKTQSIKRTTRTMFAVREVSDADIQRKAEELVSGLLAPPPPPKPQPVEPAPPRVLPVPDESGDPQPLEASSDGLSGKRVAGFALLGGAALSVGLSVFAFVEIDRAEHNVDLDRYRRAVGQSDPTVDDVCDEAAGERRYGLDDDSFAQVKDQCGAGRTFEVLQFVFLGAAAVSGGLSAYMLLSDDSRTERKPTSLLDMLPIQPVVRLNAAEVRAKLKF
jgi:hypothetical protein